MRRTLAVVMVGAILVGCAETATPPADANASDTLEVRCDGETTEVLTPMVQARTDGVHVLVTNTSEAEVLVQWDSGGDGADPGESPFLVPIAPGRSRFRCLPSTHDVDPGVEGGWAAFDVIPFEGWISPEVDCPGTMYGGAGSFEEDARGVADPLADAVEQFQEEGDKVIQAGYATPDERTYVLLRDDEPIAGLVYISDGHGGWIQAESYGCSD